MPKKIKLKKDMYLSDTSAIHNDIILNDFLHAQNINTVSTDLNNYKKPGIYHFAADFTPKNIPVGVNGWLVVIDSDEYLATKQIWFRYGTRNSNDFETYVRTYVAENWSIWRRYVIENELYYTPGETDMIEEWYGGGFITSAGTQINVTLPLPKRADKVSKVTILAGTCDVRHVNGGYLENSLDLTNSKVSVFRLRKNTMTIKIIQSSAYSTTNNTPVGVQIDNLSIRFD